MNKLARLSSSPKRSHLSAGISVPVKAQVNGAKSFAVVASQSSPPQSRLASSASVPVPSAGPGYEVKSSLYRRRGGESSMGLSTSSVFILKNVTGQLSSSSSVYGSPLLKRSYHLSSSQSYARFKLSLERQSPGKKMEFNEETAEGQDGDHPDPEDKGESYLKSHAYRQLCTWRSKSELAEVLVENQIHNDHGLFVTNKPFGVGVKNPPPHHKGAYANSQQLHVRGLQTSPYTLEDALPDLRHILNKRKLVLVKSTEKMTSGLAVFADDEEIGVKFSKTLKSSKISLHTIFKYHVITTLPPLVPQYQVHDPTKYEKVGLIIKNTFGSDKGQPVLERDYSQNSIKRQDVKSIHVQTRLLKAGYNAGYLVEIGTSHVSKNFLRVHCADKLAPLLGDHLYWNRVRMLKGIPTKIDPTHLVPGTEAQKLPDKMIDLLQLKSPEDTVMIPAHAHLRSYKLKKFLGKNTEMELEAPYPPYFKWTCGQLGISVYEEPM